MSRSAEVIYQELVQLIEARQWLPQKLTLDDLRANNTIFMNPEDMMFYFYRVLCEHMEQERDAVLRTVAEYLAAQQPTH